MAEVFRQLDFVVYDFPEWILYCAKGWREFIEAETKEQKYAILYNMYKDVDVVTDCCHFLYYKELMDVFPEAKLIHWSRPEDSWWKSMKSQMEEFDQIFGVNPDWYNALYTRVMFPSMVDFNFCRLNIFDPIYFGRNVEIKNWKHQFRNVATLEVDARRTYRQHNNDVLSTDPKKLLVLKDFSGGWKPVCAFVGCDVPDKPWPHLNKAGSTIAWLFTDLQSPVVQRNLKEMVERKALINKLLVVVLISIFLGYFFM